MTHSFILAFCLGLCLTAATIERTIQSYEGHVFSAGLATLFVSLLTWMSVSYISNNDCVNYGFFTSGCVISTMYIAHQHKKP